MVRGKLLAVNVRTGTGLRHINIVIAILNLYNFKAQMSSMRNKGCMLIILCVCYLT